jgi:hypothetical protein
MSRRPQLHGCHRFKRIEALAAACLLALAAVGPAEPAPRALMCALQLHAGRHAVPALVYAGSQLVAASAERLVLVPGHAVGCQEPAATAVLQPLERALPGLPGAVFTRPLEVHLDPRLPPGQAPLGGIEVHVSSRAILVASTAVRALPVNAWRHELLHVLAAPAPEHPGARHLWLALEEGLVEYLARPGEAEPYRHLPEAVFTAAGSAPPYWAEALLSPGYDPHPLAAELARALAAPLAEPGPPLREWLGCLSTPALGTSRSNELSAVLQGFAERCPPRAAARLAAAFRRRGSAGNGSGITAAPSLESL